MFYNTHYKFLFECPICLEEREHLEGIRLHDDHYLCLPCFCGAQFSKNVKDAQGLLGWNREKQIIEVDVTCTPIQCPLCRKDCRVILTNPMLNKSRYQDKFSILLQLAQSYMKQLHRYEAQKPKSPEDFWIREAYEKLIADSEAAIIEEFKITTFQTTLPYIASRLRDVYAVMEEKITPKQEYHFYTRCFRDFIELAHKFEDLQQEMLKPENYRKFRKEQAKKKKVKI